MMKIGAVALETEVAEQVWATMSSPGYGHPASVAVAKGHGPCRHCLKPFRVGKEQRTLFTYNPFRGEGMIPAPGPVFIHTVECERYSSEEGYPAELVAYPVVLEGYDSGQSVVARRRAEPRQQEGAVMSLFRDVAVRYVMVRDLKAGCFDFRLERMQEEV